MSSTLGTLYKVSTFGESHCKGVGAIVDGCPPGMELSEADIQPQLSRRRPGQSDLTTPRQEADQVTIYSGTEFGRTLGTPIMLLIHNKDQRPGDYGEMSTIPRPSHADFTYQLKYGIRASSGGGRSSARETIGRVAAGAIAEKWLQQNYGTEIVAWVSSVGDIEAPAIDPGRISRQEVDSTLIRCPHGPTAELMEQRVAEILEAKDSTGGILTCVCRNLPVGLGEPIFDKLDACLAQAMLSLPATKGFDIGSGFAGTRMRGSEHNDPFVRKGAGLGTSSNNSGGVQGGISNGEPIIFRVAFKPVATIGRVQQTVDFDGNQVELAAKGRHDPCVVPRAIPIVESMAALVLMDLALQQRARQGG
ncbi:chorismate synthase [Desulfogranum mediterraneum]|uniref:chorismate synthase n=1 Tax=Desulfogranum mediterraneum TaxID=160661 RepID=UPI0003FECE88|nr:chorismate synthase [Desulfogranum mediterraneum]